MTVVDGLFDVFVGDGSAKADVHAGPAKSGRRIGL
jgi:hypothetical protein